MLQKFGSFARTAARRSIKSAPKKAKTKHGFQTTYRSGKKAGQRRFVRGKYSRPGSPPYSRDKRSKDIRYAVNASRGYVICGPVVYSDASKRSSRRATNVAEFGGRTTLTFGGYRKKKKSGETKYVRKWRKSVNYAARPYLYPAGKQAAADVMRSVEQDKIFLRAWRAS
ncbi:MAG: hypothetical protein F9B45_29155 [Phycisphaera sp. RhM]|nr:hypothetical protein [Phycisphaera sp. RhM]